MIGSLYMNDIQEEVRQYLSEIGKKGGNVNKKKGSEYFKWVRSHGTQKKKEEKNEEDGKSR